MQDVELELGATLLKPGRIRFCVWAPKAETVDVHLVAPADKCFPLHQDDRGYFSGIMDYAPEDDPGSIRYFYRLDKGKERPDPASRFQPEGVHGPSAVTGKSFAWTDDGWEGIPLHTYIFYELHVGTFTPEGTFDGVISHLDDLRKLGVTAVELMPVAQFPGSRNWGYDGVYPFAVQDSYGGPSGLKRLVNACHQKGLAVVLDVVYNHLGPEGNYLYDYGYYFSDRYRTPWGDHVNFDGPFSDEVRRYFTENALYWFTQFHVDALRLDAVHAILDFSAIPFLSELAAAVDHLGKSQNRHIHLLPESDLNDVRLIQSPAAGGYGLDAQWNDDFHHALHSILTGETNGYYQDFGRLDHLVKALTHKFVHDGVYSGFRKRRHGNSARTLPSEKFVVCSQNHDQVGNRMKGDRLTRLVPENAVKLAASVVLLSPYLPLLFMGEEYGETNPFPYFVSHSDPDLVQAVRNGRKEEFKSFAWDGTPPDPQDLSTFESAVLHRKNRLAAGTHRDIHAYYRKLIRLRKKMIPTELADKKNMEVTRLSRQPGICIRYAHKKADIAVIFCFAKERISYSLPLSPGVWEKLLDNSDPGDPTNEPIPRQMVSTGSVELNLPPYACLVLIKPHLPGDIEEFLP
jgi:maltooligosyltrehalose trehalohydrolase